MPERQPQPLEIADDVVQELTVAKMALEMDDPERAMAALATALDSARQLAGQLVEDSGDLVRQRPTPL